MSVTTTDDRYSLWFNNGLQLWQVFDNDTKEVVETPFAVGYANGFLPVKEPLTSLGEAYSDLDQVMRSLPLDLKEGKFGGKAHAIPNLLSQIEGEKDPHILAALFRDYCFLASAYFLEPCNLFFQTHNVETLAEYGNGSNLYGHARTHLPANIAQPLLWLGSCLKLYPYLDYAHAYSLNNWRKRDPAGGMELENLDLIRKFLARPAPGQQDNEVGFTTVHIAMEAFTGDLVRHGDRLLELAHNKADNEVEDCNRWEDDMSDALRCICETMQKIITAFNQMYAACSPEKYVYEVRTWIMGQEGNSGEGKMFPDYGVIYEGDRENADGRKFRGETGAQSTIIPYMDILMGVDRFYPNNKLTAYLEDLRPYRPLAHRLWLTRIKEEAASLHLAETLANAGPRVKFHHLTCLDQIRRFRMVHWTYVHHYIMKRTAHPVATGGTPIATWLPNQLDATTTFMVEIIEKLKAHDASEHLRDNEFESYQTIATNVESAVAEVRQTQQAAREKYHQ